MSETTGFCEFGRRSLRSAPSRTCTRATASGRRRPFSSG